MRRVVDIFEKWRLNEILKNLGLWYIFGNKGLKKMQEKWGLIKVMFSDFKTCNRFQ